MTMGRPTDYSEALADAICERLADGESLRSICKSEQMPSDRTVYRWLQDDRHSDFRHQYMHARECQADTMVEEMLSIADQGGMADAVEVQQARLRIETRKWLAGKMRPKVYGDKAEVEHKGVIGVAAIEWRVPNTGD